MKQNAKLAIHEKVITKLFNPNKSFTFFDIGACEGLSSVRYLSLFPKTTMYAFEPVPKNFDQVLKNKKANNLKNMHPFKLGLSSKKGEAIFYISSGNPPNKDRPADNSTSFGNKSSSLYKPGKTKEIHPWLEFNETITIDTDTLENFCKEQNVNSIDFIHMDVQGAELKVLQGAHKMISYIKSIWLEVEKIALYEDQALKNDIEDFLVKHNFICILNKVNHISGDQLWVQKDYFNQLNKKTKSSINKISLKTDLKSKVSSFVGNTKNIIKKSFKG